MFIDKYTQETLSKLDKKKLLDENSSCPTLFLAKPNYSIAIYSLVIMFNTYADWVIFVASQYLAKGGYRYVADIIIVW